jgi:predicted DNA-binding ribbon-helix-helix protein
MPRPAYRRGRGLRQHSFRLSEEVLTVLRAEAARRHVWVSALVEQVLLQELTPAAGAAVGGNNEDTVSGNQSAARHWCRIAIEAPVWEGLKREATRRGMSIPQLIRQHLGAFGSVESPRSDRSQTAAIDSVEPILSRPSGPRLAAERPRLERGEPRPEPIPVDTGLPTKPLPVFELT